MILTIIVFAWAQDLEVPKYASLFQAIFENLEIQAEQSICVDDRAVI